MNKNPNPKNYSISKKSKSNQLFSLKKFSQHFQKSPNHSQPPPPSNSRHFSWISNKERVKAATD